MCPSCHPERSEGSVKHKVGVTEILRRKLLRMTKGENVARHVPT